MSNVEKKGRIPSCVGQASLAGSYYVAECTLCGWVGSSEVTGQQTHLSDPTAKGDGVHLFKWTPLLAF